MGNGKDFWFWTDRWLKNRTLRQQFPQLFNHTTMPTARIAHMGDLNLFWKRHLRHSKLEQVNHLLAQLEGVKLIKASHNRFKTLGS